MRQSNSSACERSSPGLSGAATGCLDGFALVASLPIVMGPFFLIPDLTTIVVLSLRRFVRSPDGVFKDGAVMSDAASPYGVRISSGVAPMERKTRERLR